MLTRRGRRLRTGSQGKVIPDVVGEVVVPRASDYFCRTVHDKEAGVVRRSSFSLLPGVCPSDLPISSCPLRKTGQRMISRTGEAQ
jgi:hypothetical protein